jgi:hypothetical protein
MGLPQRDGVGVWLLADAPVQAVLGLLSGMASFVRSFRFGLGSLIATSLVLKLCSL